MSTIDAIYASGRIVYLILVPVLRELSAVLLAFAILKDCKARDNGSGALWGLFTLLAPVLSGIIYFVYSRLLVKRKGNTPKDKKQIISARKLTFLSISTYVISLIVALAALITSTASGLTTIISEAYLH